MASPKSWPYHVLIEQNYKFLFYGSEVTKATYCAGTLINRYTILTSSSCVVSQYKYDYYGTNYDINVVTNQFYPTFASMFTVYLGINDLSFFTGSTTRPDSLFVANVSEIISVILNSNNLYFFITFHFFVLQHFYFS